MLIMEDGLLLLSFIPPFPLFLPIDSGQSRLTGPCLADLCYLKDLRQMSHAMNFLSQILSSPSLVSFPPVEVDDAGKLCCVVM